MTEWKSPQHEPNPPHQSEALKVAHAALDAIREVDRTLFIGVGCGLLVLALNHCSLERVATKLERIADQQENHERLP